MKKDEHPPVSAITLEDVLNALADPMRLRIYAEIEAAKTPLICSHFLKIDNKTVPKSTLSKHFKILRAAGLIRCDRRGVEMLNSSRAREFRSAHGDVVEAIVAAYRKQTARGKKR
ncbi:MAG: helix-turn-helix domain-containing protein [Bdellovibrionota bacterium]